MDLEDIVTGYCNWLCQFFVLSNVLELPEDQISFYGCVAPNLSPSCQPLNNAELINICIGAYPREAKQKYGDNYVKSGLSYTVFGMNGRKGHYMISHGDSPLNNCRNITVTSPRHIKCKGRDINLKSAILRCLPFHSQLSDDLILHCFKGSEKPKAVFTAMFYVTGQLYRDEDTGSRTVCTSLSILVSFIVTQLIKTLKHPQNGFEDLKSVNSI
ncbi:hypothetical protein GQX74_001184 [Glossina fuscipes]|nr:hypothetical protein GQX74_001184 [Glossina fuscipes]